MKIPQMYIFLGRLSTMLFLINLNACSVPDGINVEIVNNSNHEIRAITVNYTGGAAEIGPLGIDESRTIKIKPTGESHIELGIHPVGGKLEKRLVDTYFEPGYRGKVEITLTNGFTALSTQELTVR